MCRESQSVRSRLTSVLVCVKFHLVPLSVLDRLDGEFPWIRRDLSLSALTPCSFQTSQRLFLCLLALMLFFKLSGRDCRWNKTLSDPQMSELSETHDWNASDISASANESSALAHSPDNEEALIKWNRCKVEDRGEHGLWKHQHKHQTAGNPAMLYSSVRSLLSRAMVW